MTCRCPRPASPSLDLQSLAQRYRSGETSPTQMVDDLLRRMAEAPDYSIWIHRLTPRELFSQARAVEQRRANGERLPLYGLPFAVKDIFDVAGHPTTAGCPAFSYVAKTTSPVVSRLMDAGAILVGKTNLDQFSTGLAGDRTPYGVPGNLFDENYIAGGSSSGSALAVAAGLVSFAPGERHRRFGPSARRLQQHCRAKADAWLAEHGRHGPGLPLAGLRGRVRA